MNKLRYLILCNLRDYAEQIHAWAAARAFKYAPDKRWSHVNDKLYGFAGGTLFKTIDASNTHALAAEGIKPAEWMRK